MKNMIRLFISSTFRDFENERNQLALNVYPELKAYCQQHGFSFQVLDLRWGVPIQAALDNRAMQICLDEIEHCQRLSPHLNFLLMVGNRSGWQPIPVMIPHDEWTKMALQKEYPPLPQKIDRLCWLFLFEGDTYFDVNDLYQWYHYSEKDNCFVLSDAEGIPQNISEIIFSQMFTLLNQWYAIDENDIHENCYLRARTEAEDADWWRTERVLWHILSYLSHCYLTDSQSLQKYTLSATSQEIFKGLLSLPKESAKKHVFALFKDGEDGDENQESIQQTNELKEKISQCLPESNICWNASDYSDRIKNFLLEIVGEQIHQIEEQTEFQNDIDNLEKEFSVIEKQYIAPEQSTLQETFNTFCKDKKGKFVLITGASGSGKSYFLKYQAFINRNSKPVAAVYTDIFPKYRSFGKAISFLFQQLQHQKILNNLSEMPIDSYRFIPWIQEQFDKLNSEKEILIILDCVENIQDWKNITGSLFQIHLPANVTFVVSCISANSLNQRDLKYSPPVLKMPVLNQISGMDMLNQKLSLYGRRLQEHQKQWIREHMPEQPSPLHLELISFDCQKLTSHVKSGDMSENTFQSVRDAVNHLFFRSERKEYFTLRQHILGYISLSNIGLAEEELLELLKSDRAVIEEIMKYHPDWSKDLKLMLEKDFPSALWARIYFEIQPFLNELEQNGVILFQFRHQLLTKYVQEIIGETVVKELNESMKNYFHQKKWVFHDEKQNILPNFRKIQELPKLLSMPELAEWLEDSRCIDCFVRCGRLSEAVTLLTDCSLLYKTSPKREKLLLLLKKKQELFQVWSDSFMQSAVSAGLAFPEQLQEYHQNCWISIKGDNELPKSFLFHEISTDVLALNHYGILASLTNGIVRIANLNLGIVTDIFCAVETEPCAMYWVKNELILRSQYERVTLVYTGNELYEQSRERCSDFPETSKPTGIAFDDFYSWAEYERFFNNQAKLIFYRATSSVKTASLPYSTKDFHRVRLRKNMVAVLLKGYLLEVIDLENGILLERHSFPPVKDILWSSSGNDLLIVLEDGNLLLHSVKKNQYLQKIDLSVSYIEPNFSSPIAILSTTIREIRECILFFSSQVAEFQRLDIITKNRGALHEGDSTKQTDRFPQLLSFSTKTKKIACYYRYGSESLLRIYHLDSRQLLAECSVLPVYHNDTKSCAMYFIHEGEELVLASGGIYHILNLDSGKWRKTSSRPAMDGENLPVVSQIRERYASKTIRSSAKYSETPQSLQQYKVKKPFRGMLVDGLIEILARFSFFLLFGRMSYTPADKVDLMRNQLQMLPVCIHGNTLWIIDNIHNMIHICDSNGNWLCHEQLEMNLSWADMDDTGILVALSKYTGIITTCEIKWFF